MNSLKSKEVLEKHSSLIWFTKFDIILFTTDNKMFCFLLRKHNIHKYFPQKTEKTYWKTETYMAERTVLLPLYWISPLLLNPIFLLQRILQIYFFFVILYDIWTLITLLNIFQKPLYSTSNIHVSTPYSYAWLQFHWIEFKEHFSTNIWLDECLSQLWIVYPSGKTVGKCFFYSHKRFHFVYIAVYVV